MRAVSTKAFNAMGVISPEKGTIIDTKSAVTIAQLKNMGFVELAEEKGEVSDDINVKATKRAKKK